MQDSSELRLEILKIAATVSGSHKALMKTAEELRAYVLAPTLPETTLIEALNETLTPGQERAGRLKDDLEWDAGDRACDP